MSIQSFLKEYGEVFDRQPWFGTSIWKTLGELSFNQVNYKPAEGFHSIAELVKHIISWRIFVIEKIKENEAFDIELNTQADWAKDTKTGTPEKWEDLLNELKKSQADILDALNNKNDDWLRERVKGKEYSHAFMLRGILQHDIYHLGQIRLLAKMSDSIIS